MLAAGALRTLRSRLGTNISSIFVTPLTSERVARARRTFAEPPPSRVVQFWRQTLILLRIALTHIHAPKAADQLRL
jgi:hypothetical protein